MNKAYLLLGSNEGDRSQFLFNALQCMEKIATVAKTSSIYETAAWGLEEQPAFLNMAILLKTNLSPYELLTSVQHIENEAGRQRQVKWGQRTLDIDILLYNDIVLQSQQLTIPHPFLPQRRFALAPLAEIAPGYIHPQSGKTIRELLSMCPDPLEAKKYMGNNK